VRPSDGLEGRTACLAGGLRSASGFSEASDASVASSIASFPSFGSCKKLITEGSTETMSPGAKRVLEFECFLPLSMT